MSLQAIEFDLQITPGSVPPVLHMAQYDSGRQYTAYLKDETNTAFVPGTGATAKIKGFNAAGVAWEQAATVDGSTVVFVPSGAATDQFGVMPVTIEITVGEEILTPLLVVFDIQRAGYTNEEAARSPEFQTAIEAAVAAAIEEGGLGFSTEFKEALLACFAHVAWADDQGQTYYDALEDALYPAPGPATLVSITADYQQDRPIYDTDDLDVIKTSDDLTVTAHYSDGTSVVLADDDYELSGTLTVGTSTITVSYEGKTTTISVLVTQTVVGWYYPFNNSIASQGTHEFGLTGVAAYADGVNTGEKCYYHHVATEGDASTDPLGLYNLNCTDFPTWSNSDFTISTWFKSAANMLGHIFCAEKYIDNTTGIVWTAEPANVKTGWTVTRTPTTKKHVGIRLGTVSLKLVLSLMNAAATAGGTYTIEPPSGFDMTHWHHYALTRSGATVYYFIDGEIIFTITLSSSTELYSSGVIAIGNLIKEQSTVAVQPYAYSTYHQDLFVNLGTCKWTSDFDPSSIVY